VRRIASSIAVAICTDNELGVSLGGTTPHNQDKLVERVSTIVHNLLDGNVIVIESGDELTTEVRRHMEANAGSVVDWRGKEGCRCQNCFVLRGTARADAMWAQVMSARLRQQRPSEGEQAEQAEQAEQTVELYNLTTGIRSHGGDEEDDLERERRTR
jgi:hypothetical protein